MNMNSNTSINSNDDNKNKNEKKKHSDTAKSSYWCPAMVERPRDGSINVIVMRQDMHNLITKQSVVLLDMMERDMKRRALGMDIVYEDKVTRGGAVKKVRLQLLDHLDWAPAPNSGGGGSTAFSAIEKSVLADGACPFVNLNHLILKCNIELGPLSSGNMGKIWRSYVSIMYCLKYGKKFPDMVRKRSQESLRKRLKLSLEKKHMTPDAIKIRETFSNWCPRLNVVKTSFVSISFVNTFISEL